MCIVLRVYTLDSTYFLCLYNAERPTVDVRPAILEVNLGDTAAFTCTVGGHPLPSVKWVEVSTGLVVGEENTEQGKGNCSRLTLAWLVTYCSRS